jgi:hypothetical protein
MNPKVLPVLMSTFLAFLFGFTWGAVAWLFDTRVGIIVGSVLSFACFYMLQKRISDRTPMGDRRFNDRY